MIQVNNRVVDLNKAQVELENRRLTLSNFLWFEDLLASSRHIILSYISDFLSDYILITLNIINKNKLLSHALMSKWKVLVISV